MSDQNIQQNNVSQEESEYTFRDLYDQVRADWAWFLISIIACISIAVLYLKTTHSEYSRTATVLIKDEKKGGAGVTESALFSELGIMGGVSTVDNEMIVFQSTKLMEDVVRRLGLNVVYVKPALFKSEDLYGHSPVVVKFLDNDDTEPIQLVITPRDDKKFSIHSFVIDEEKYSYKREAGYGDTLSTPAGRLVVEKTLYLDEETYGDDIEISHLPMKKVVTMYRKVVSVTLSSKTASALTLSMIDIVPRRAEDVINTLIEVYNEDAIEDKNQVAESTKNFIDERLSIIGRDLEDVDARIEQYKRSNEIADITSEMTVTLQAESEYKRQSLSVENEIRIAEFIREYLTSPSKADDLIPVNTGIQDEGINTMITQYNTKKIERDRLLANSGAKNPLVQDKNTELLALKKSIISSIDNLLTSLHIQQKGLKAQDEKTKRRIATVPSQEKEVMSLLIKD